MRHFVQALEDVSQCLLKMGGLVESSVHCSVQALQERDQRLAMRIVEDEPQINRLEMDIDARVSRLLALHQPVAGDLRFLMSVLKINGDLERTGDLALNIARRALSFMRKPAVNGIMEITMMGSLAEDMLHRSLDAFMQKDADLAGLVLPADDEVDGLRDRVFEQMIGVMQEDAEKIPAALDLVFVARHLERTADHATNIAKDVIFLVRGEDVRQ